MWEDILKTNSGEIKQFIRKFQDKLAIFLEAIDKEDLHEAFKMMGNAKESRDEWIENYCSK